LTEETVLEEEEVAQQREVTEKATGVTLKILSSLVRKLVLIMSM
jgi:hypothetical protein